MKPKIIIVVEGGMIQQTLSDVPIDVCIIDYDVDTLDEESITKIPFGIDVADAICRLESTELNPYQVNKLYEFIENDLNGKPNE